MPTAQKRIPVTTVLSIAGSDPSGGAGIQADLKTFAVIGVYGGAVISSLTVQNTMGVSSVIPLPPELVWEQISAVLADLAVSHVKIGMVGTLETAKAIGDALDDFEGEVIYDPVMRATSGKPLVEEDGAAVLAEHLVARATVLTPNIPELRQLVGRTNNTLSEAEAAAGLFDRFPRLKALALTGGHGQATNDTVTDQLYWRPDTNTPITHIARSHPKIRTANSHGTGCTFAAAFAAFHQQTGEYPTAFARTVAFLSQLIQQSAAYRIGNGNGPLLHHLLRKTEI
ncbi:MAG: bifunctional hydroxymethylpyrimidine kinase/phosphomethylpyrimidine kinase [Desulfobulbaceae bacterium]|nr:bifunctional hydroxymethylpyrimidine kinase/phosphomethylpyrimidine kinase [Desulfobulbaceae bacterium]